MLKIFSKKFDKNYHLDVKKTHISCIRGDFFFSHSAAWKMQKCIRCMQSCSHAVCVRKKKSPSGCHVRLTCLVSFCLSVFLGLLRMTLMFNPNRLSFWKCKDQSLHQSLDCSTGRWSLSTALAALRLSTCTTCSANAMNIVVQLPQGTRQASQAILTS